MTKATGRFFLAVLLVLVTWPLTNSAAEVSQEDLNANLIAAAGQGRLASFNLVLGQGANIHAVDRHGNNAVLMATQGRQFAMLRTLLDKGVNPDVRGGTGFTPLTYVALHGLNGELQLLLKAGADPNLRNARGDAPLHLAVEFGRHEIVAELIRAGARIEGLNAAGETPLIIAVRLDNRKAFDTLLAQGARAGVQDSTGRSALFLAIWESREAMALALIENGAGFDSSFDGQTPLRMAQLMQQSRVVEALESRGAGR